MTALDDEIRLLARDTKAAVAFKPDAVYGTLQSVSSDGTSGILVDQNGQSIVAHAAPGVVLRSGAQAAGQIPRDNNVNAQATITVINPQDSGNQQQARPTLPDPVVSSIALIIYNPNPPPGTPIFVQAIGTMQAVGQNLNPIQYDMAVIPTANTPTPNGPDDWPRAPTVHSPNPRTATLQAGITSGATSLATNESMTGWPAADDIVIDGEIIGYSGRTLPHTLSTLVRGKGGTTAAAHGAGAQLRDMRAAYTTLSSNITSIATTVPVVAVTGFAVNDVIIIDGEQMLVTAVNLGGPSFTVTRGYGGTGGQQAAHTSGATVRQHTPLVVIPSLPVYSPNVNYSISLSYLVSYGGGVIRSNWSEPQVLTAVLDTTAPPVPTGVGGAWAADARSVIFTATASTAGDFDHFHVNIRKHTGITDTNYTFDVSGIYGTYALVYDSTSTYFIKAQAVDHSNNASAYSSEVSVTTPPLPAVPTGVAGQLLSNNSGVSASCTLQADATIYEFSVKRDGVVLGSVQSATPNAVYQFASPNQSPPSVGYTVAARALNLAGASSYSTYVTVTLDTTAPATPTGLAFVPVLQGVQASWTKNTEYDLAGYELQVRRDGTTTIYDFDVSNNASSIVIPLPKISGSHTYDCRLAAFDFATPRNQSSYSAYVALASSVDMGSDANDLSNNSSNILLAASAMNVSDVITNGINANANTVSNVAGRLDGAPNGDFELWIAGAPANWTAVGTVTQETNLTNVNSGLSSAKMHPTGSVAVTLTSTKPLYINSSTSGVYVSLEAWMKTLGTCTANILWYNSSNTLLHTDTATLVGPSGTIAKLTVQTWSGAQYCKLQFISDTTSDTWVDNVLFMRALNGDQVNPSFNIPSGTVTTDHFVANTDILLAGTALIAPPFASKYVQLTTGQGRLSAGSDSTITSTTEADIANFSISVTKDANIDLYAWVIFSGFLTITGAASDGGYLVFADGSNTLYGRKRTYRTQTNAYDFEIMERIAIPHGAGSVTVKLRWAAWNGTPNTLKITMTDTNVNPSYLYWTTRQ